MFTPDHPKGLIPEMMGIGPPQLRYIDSSNIIDSGSHIESAEEILILEERLVNESLIDICLYRAQESQSGYSAAFFVRDFERNGMFDNPLQGYVEIDHFARNQAISNKPVL